MVILPVRGSMAEGMDMLRFRIKPVFGFYLLEFWKIREGFVWCEWIVWDGIGWNGNLFCMSMDVSFGILECEMCMGY